MSVVAIIQARLACRRVPNKVLAPLAGRPLIEQLIRRVEAARGIDRVCVATTELERDTPLADCARACGALVFRGNDRDLLGRYQQAASELGADVVVRLRGNCPLLDPALLDEMLAARAKLVRGGETIDYYANLWPRTYPLGLDIEIVTRSALERVASMVCSSCGRADVTSGIIHHAEAFRLVNHAQPERHEAAWRWLVETPEDLAFVAAVYDELYETDPLFGRAAVKELLRHRPELAAASAPAAARPAAARA